MSEDTDVLVGAAWEDLAAGRWPQARATFERVLEREQVAEALHGLAEALLWLGETDAAVQHYERAYASFRRRPDPALAGLCALALYFAHRVSLGNVAASRGWLGRLARLVDEHDLGPLRGWVALARANDRAGAATAGELAREALALAREAGDVDLELCALSQLGAALVECGHVEEGVALLDEALTASLAGEATSLDTVVLTSCLMIQCCSHAADFERAAEWVRLSDEFTARYGSPHLYTTCRLHVGRVLTATGRWDAADRELQRALHTARTGERGMIAEVAAALAELRLAQGRLEDAAILLDGLAGHPAATCAQATLQLARGEREAAGALLRRRTRATGEERLESAALVELLVEVQVAQGEHAAAARRAARLAAFAARTGCAAVGARAERALGRAHAGSPAARDHLERSLEVFTAAGMPYEAARAQLLLAEHLAGPARDAAVAEARAAHATFERLGAGRDADAAGALLRSLGVSAPRHSGARSADVLTKREREVLALLGEGLPNRAIAERLYLAPKTVEHHVRSVLSKLGLERRAEAAALWVRERGRGAERAAR